MRSLLSFRNALFFVLFFVQPHLVSALPDPDSDDEHNDQPNQDVNPAAAPGFGSPLADGEFGAMSASATTSTRNQVDQLSDELVKNAKALITQLEDINKRTVFRTTNGIDDGEVDNLLNYARWVSFGSPTNSMPSIILPMTDEEKTRLRALFDGVIFRQAQRQLARSASDTYQLAPAEVGAPGSESDNYGVLSVNTSRSFFAGVGLQTKNVPGASFFATPSSGQTIPFGGADLYGAGFEDVDRRNALKRLLGSSSAGIHTEDKRKLFQGLTAYNAIADKCANPEALHDIPDMDETSPGEPQLVSKDRIPERDFQARMKKLYKQVLTANKILEAMRQKDKKNFAHVAVELKKEDSARNGPSHPPEKKE